MTKKIRAQDLTFILVRPRYAGNIGSVARAIKNMGFSKLVAVRPSVLPTHPEARRLAVGAEHLLHRVKVFETIEEACKGLQFIVGTSRRTGKYRQDFILLPEIGRHLPVGQKIGILFGPEERGLANKELSLCHLVCTIPSDPRFPSLNLAQAVMTIAYQLRLDRLQSAGGAFKTVHALIAADQRRRPPVLAPVGEIEGMYGHLEKMLTAVGFFPHRNAFHMMRAIRQIFGRTSLTDREVRIWRGICRQVLWSVSTNRTVV